MRVTSTGQITIPRHVREMLGIAPGSEVAFELDADGARLVSVDPGDTRGPSRGRAGGATVTMTTEEIPALTHPHD